MTLRIRIRTTGWPGATPPAALFEGMTTSRVPGAWTIMSSMAAHILVIALFAVVSHQMSKWSDGDDHIDWSRYQVEPLRLHLAEPLFFRASTPGRVPNPPSGVRRPDKPARQGRGESGASGSPIPRHLELPLPPQISKNALVLLQPDFSPQIMPPPALPPLAFWARQGVDLPKPPPSNQVVVPGRTEGQSPAPSLAARPVLAVPNREQEVADINVSQSQTQAPKPPTVSLANSATIPVRVRDATETRTSSFEALPGQATNVLSLAAERRDVKDVLVPRGLQSIPSPAGGDTADPTDGEAVTALTKGGKSTRAEPDVGSAGSKSSARVNANTRSAPQGQSSASARSAAPETATPSHADGEGRSAGPPVTRTTSLPRSPSAPETTRIEHPTNGSFDVVVMQSRARDDLPDVGGMLTGNPVYTVYLRVGDQREWLLEYCAQTGESPQGNPYQINIDDAAPITPPYPISTTIPNNILGQPITRHIVLHAFLTASGNLRNVKAIDANNPLVIQILALLSEWQFRPALRKNKPIDIEILLVVPARS